MFLIALKIRIPIKKKLKTYYLIIIVIIDTYNSDIII